MVMAKTLRTDSPSSHGGDESEIDFFFEFASSYSYLAAARIDPLAAAAGRRVRKHPGALAPRVRSGGLSRQLRGRPRYRRRGDPGRNPEDRGRLADRTRASGNE